MKKLLIILGILVAFLVVLGAGAVLLIDPIVRRGVEKSSSAALKVPTRLSEASVSFSGKAELKRFEIDNPSGFQEPRAVAFERFDVALSPRELLDSTIDIERVTVVKPELTLEFTGTKSNLSALLDNLPKPRSTADQEGKKFLIRKLRIEGAVVRFRSDLLSGGSRSLTLPAIDLENIGTAEGGASIGEILRVLLQTLATSALGSADGMLPRQLLEALRGDLVTRLQELPGRTMDDLRRKLEDVKTRELTPENAERRLRDLLEKKAD